MTSIDDRTARRLRKLADTLNAVRAGMDEDTFVSAATVGYLEAQTDLKVELWDRAEFRSLGGALRRDIERTKADIRPLIALPDSDLADALIALCVRRAEDAVATRDLIIATLRDTATTRTHAKAA